MLSVIMPSWREGPRLLEAIRAVRIAVDAAQIVVVACEERGPVREAACAEGVVWIEAPRPCRGLQLALGGERAAGDALAFLHADTRLPFGAGKLIECALAKPGVAGGAFRLRFDLAHPVLDLLARLSALSIIPSFLGDQCIFCSRAAYRAAGGVRAVHLSEDVDFARRLARIGRLVRLPQEVTTSSRRFKRRGPLRQLLGNAALLLAYHAGVGTERLHAIYERGHLTERYENALPLFVRPRHHIAWRGRARPRPRGRD